MYINKIFLVDVYNLSQIFASIFSDKVILTLKNLKLKNCLDAIVTKWTLLELFVQYFCHL